MSVSEFTITMHGADNSAPKTSTTQTTQESARAFFHEWYGKYIIAITTAFVMLMTFIYSVFAATQAEYIPSALILMVTLWIISELLEKDGEQNG